MAIENIKKDQLDFKPISGEADILNFEEMCYETYLLDSYGYSQRAYLMNKDGFSLLAMEFTGKEALNRKLKYISMFNGLEQRLNSSEKFMAIALQEMLLNKQKRGYKDQDAIFHSDQGIIYSSLAFNDAHKDYNIVRSMSRIATPTDNPIIESKNGWIKKEMYIDFNQEDYENVYDYINAIIYDYNNFRPAYALKYKTPIQFRTELGF